MPYPVKRELVLTPEQEERRLISVKEAAKLKCISIATFKRHYAHIIEQVSPGRKGVRLGNVLD
jgi:hypothetical protein